ncbi:hypothetical protein M7I_1059 [Glarea lozoyensis 74030]|uniref:Uncharacterized protein n=1 Tax=Glarea lozoyensis (strain ATCC 74030 / MF5533) TaxID=1104152 RepID=H0EF21_GLAL7|nr:hypothetical protein M7I_1059 [Glarea lozoyensis 74030]
MLTKMWYNENQASPEMIRTAVLAEMEIIFNTGIQMDERSEMWLEETDELGIMFMGIQILRFMEIVLWPSSLRFGDSWRGERGA